MARVLDFSAISSSVANLLVKFKAGNASAQVASWEIAAAVAMAMGIGGGGEMEAVHEVTNENSVSGVNSFTLLSNSFVQMEKRAEYFAGTRGSQS